MYNNQVQALIELLGRQPNQGAMFQPNMGMAGYGQRFDQMNKFPPPQQTQPIGNQLAPYMSMQKMPVQQTQPIAPPLSGQMKPAAPPAFAGPAERGFSGRIEAAVQPPVRATDLMFPQFRNQNQPQPLTPNRPRHSLFSMV